MDFALVDSGWDSVFDDAIAASPAGIRIVCPFVKKNSVRRFLRDASPSVTQVITRFNLQDFCDGVSDISALQMLLRHGARVRGVRNLHSKLYLFAQRRVIVTSANLTEAALQRNHEFGFVSEEPGIVERCGEYFDYLWDRAGIDLEESRLRDWDEIISTVRARGSRPSVTKRLPDEGVDAGITEPLIVPPPLVLEAPQSFVKFFGVNTNRAELSMAIKEEVKRSGCHWACTYPAEKRPRQVKDGAVMFMARLVKKPDIIIYGRAVANSHQEGRDDASAADLASRPWKEKWPHYIRLHHAEFLAGSLANGISLSELMDALGANSFTSTQRNVARGEGNVNPRRAFQQQAHVSLTSQAFEWLNSRLDAAFQKHGKMASTELDDLDWPEVTVTSTFPETT